MTLLAVPNVSEGRDEATLDAIAAALGAHARLLDTHSDPDHNRTVYTLCGTAAELCDAVVEGARATVRHIRLPTQSGVHPHVGALDVAPFVFDGPGERGEATAAALLTADRLATELGLPVFLYGRLSHHGLTRADVRRGGPTALAARLAAGDAVPDFGPRRLHPTAGATLVAARPPLLAFNLELAPPADLALARVIAADLRALPGVRALGLALSKGRVQVSMNLEEPDRTSPAEVTRRVGERAPILAAEIVGLPPARHFADFPAQVPVRHRRMLEEALL